MHGPAVARPATAITGEALASALAEELDVWNASEQTVCSNAICVVTVGRARIMAVGPVCRGLAMMAV